MGKSGKPSAFHKVKARKVSSSTSAIMSKPSRTIKRGQQSQPQQKKHTTQTFQHKKNNNWAKFNGEVVLMRERTEKKSSLPLTGSFQLAPSLLPAPVLANTSEQYPAKEVFFQQTDKLFAGEQLLLSVSVLPSSAKPGGDKPHLIVDNSHQSFKALFMDEEDEIQLNVAPPRFVYEATNRAGSLTP